MGYDKRKLVSSFLSVFPINEPKYICLVLFDEPLLNNLSTNNDGATGGKTAAKTTAKIIKRIAPILGIELQNNINNLIVKKRRELILLLTNLINKDIRLSKSIEDNPIITGIDFDSRKIKKGMMFAAINGENNNGIDFCDKALKAGATTILCSKKDLK